MLEYANPTPAPLRWWHGPARMALVLVHAVSFIVGATLCYLLTTSHGFAQLPVYLAGLVVVPVQLLLAIITPGATGLFRKRVSLTERALTLCLMGGAILLPVLGFLIRG